ncbi:MAG: hypothetical protein HY342_02935 [Candidatus Lambdaproteobacteria bacterium]|nr:hypothetical protein [Candidatus Lambdaproteobacteria bacterium]
MSRDIVHQGVQQTGNQDMPGGIAGQILRIDLGSGRIWTETLTPREWRIYLGGAGLGAKILYEEVPPDSNWDDPENRLVLATGPLAGLPVWGTGGLTVVTRGALTNGATSTQANGFFGACLKYSGYDAIVLQGISPKWVYLYIRDDQVELRDAAHLLGRDTWETQQSLEQELGYRGHQLSVYTSGIAGENLVRFSAIHGDYGHVASKNGCGAVMGVKKLKAVAIVRGSRALHARDPNGLMKAAEVISHDLETNPTTRGLYQLGTLQGVVNLSKLGALPIKNYTTSVIPAGVDMAQWEGQALRDGFDHRGHQCNACGMHHCHQQVLARGKHKGDIVDEPEYEGWSGAGWAIGCTDPNAVSWLNTQIDRACVDVNEFGWLVGWCMECYEKGYFTREQLGGIDLKWGDAEAANALLQMIIRRQGFGDVLAEGVKRAAEHVGGEAQKCAIYTMKGNTPRGHDHRARWEELLDTCVGSGGSLETGPPVEPTEMGLPARTNPFDHKAVSKNVSTLMGRRHLEDSLGICIFTSRTKISNLCLAINAATGWEFSVEEAQQFGRRVAALLRAFNVRSGIGPELERPSERYGSQPVDGPAAAHDPRKIFDAMVEDYYNALGYDRATGKPLPELLRALGLGQVAKDLWG